MENINIKKIVERLNKFFNNLGKVAIIITAAVSGFAASEIYSRYEKEVKTHRMQEAKKASEIKIYLNDSELMIMDKKTGFYQLYERNVADLIFAIRANQIYNSQKN